MISNFARASLVGIFAVVTPILYLDINLILMIVREYGLTVLWIQLATAGIGSLVVWYACRSIPKDPERPAGKFRRFLKSAASKVPGVTAFATIGKVLLAFLKSFQILIAGILLIFPGFITDGLGVVSLLWHVLFPIIRPDESPDEHPDARDEKPEAQSRDSRLRSSYENARSKLGAFAKKSRDTLLKAGSKAPGRENVSSGLRAIRSRLSSLSQSKWGIDRLKKRKRKVETEQKGR